jgi:hypothetical protein
VRFCWGNPEFGQLFHQQSSRRWTDKVEGSTHSVMCPVSVPLLSRFEMPVSQRRTHHSFLQSMVENLIGIEICRVTHVEIRAHNVTQTMDVGVTVESFLEILPLGRISI